MNGSYSRFCFTPCPAAPPCKLDWLPSPCICNTPTTETPPAAESAGTTQAKAS